ncbi:polymorphic toxin-type HINT domain-containing protein [Kitasatospora sp. NPDC001095]
MRGACAILLPAALAAGLLGPAPAFAAGPEAGASSQAPVDRGQVFTLWTIGGPGVKAAAEAALTGSDEDVERFLSVEKSLAEYHDDRVSAAQILSLGGNGVREAATKALRGSEDDLRAFIKDGWKSPLEQDRRVQAAQLIATGGVNVREQATAALKGTPEDVKKFLDQGQYDARAVDNRVLTAQLMAAGGPATKEAAKVALRGTPADVAEFLEVGQFVAQARDQERATISQLADQAEQAGTRAQAATEAAKAASKRAVDLSQQAKQDAQDAARETEEAGKDLARASEAAGRAAAAAEGAAVAAQQAVSAAGAANQASRVASRAAAQAASAAGAAASAATNARRAAGAAASDAGKAAEARQRAEEARNAARDAERAAEAADHAGVSSQAAAEASTAAKSASGNAMAAADSAEKANSQANAAGASSNRAQAAAQQARRHANEADRAANAAATLAGQSAQAAFQSRDAARSAATHANNAAAAADNAAEHAGQSSDAAAESSRQAEEARNAANVATGAVKTANDVYELARRTEAEDLATRTAAAVEVARDVKLAEDEATADVGTILAEWQALETDATGLAAEAARPGADLKAVAVKARKVALQTMRGGGPWAQEAAADALSGTDGTVLAWVRTGRSKAEQDDLRQSVQELAQDSPDEAVRTAAAQALKGDAEQIRAFLTTGRHEAAATDDRVRAAQVMSTGGPSVQEAATKALRAGSTTAVAAFLQTGQHTARQIDERVQAGQLLASGGPEVQAQAKTALAGTPALVHEFLLSGQYMADRKDQLAATHAAQMRNLIAGASQTAAKAQQNAWEATEAAAVANDASAAADEARRQARTSADQAAGFATAAGQSAQEAEASATRAAAASATARKASQAAAKDAGKAMYSAARARASAENARGSAAQARSAAAQAHASAVAAGKDAGAAQQAADEAWEIVAEKEFQERVAALAAENPDLQTEAQGLEEEFKKEIEKQIQDALQEERDRREYGSCNPFKLLNAPMYIRQECAMRPPGFPVESLETLRKMGVYIEDDVRAVTQLFKVVLGVDTAEQCIKEKSVGACAELAITFFPAGKVLRLKKIAATAWSVEETAAASRLNRLVASCLRPNSFVAGTPVLMADGRTLPIERVRIGDQVRATDPETGETTSRRVENVIHTPDDRDFTDVTIASDDGRGGTITSTDEHPFWAENRHSWRNAADLRPDDALRTPDGGTARITGTKRWKTLQPAYNLTVDSVHTYYVVAGSTPVLVHNTSCPIGFVDLGGGKFKSPAGVVYGPGSKHGHRVDHVLEHGVPDPSKTTHSVFASGKDGVLGVIDKAWLKRGAPEPGDPGAFVVDMGEVVGTAGEKKVRLIVKPGTSEIITAYPWP